MIRQQPEYDALGLKVGLEIHQQLETMKLFCNCPSELEEGDDGVIETVRYLRPVQSEMGDVDAAALAEARKRLRIIYQSTPTTSCLVELDEEPPHPVNPMALETVLMVAKLLGARLVDEVDFMRKIVVDGSNTGGFQRTALVATEGKVRTEMGEVGLQTICLEEDAARKMEDREGEVVYRLDRLGIPLIEVATEPSMRTPPQVREVAEAIGMMLRATRRVKRGLGTIRQDVNVSIRDGARVEIKGVQVLRMIGTIVETEVARQVSLLDIRRKLASRGITKQSIEKDSAVADLTDIFKDCQSKVIRKGLEKKGSKVLGVRLKGFKGLLKNENEGLKLGGELSGYAKLAGVKGIFHTDELPGYGITDKEVAAVFAALKMDHNKEDAWAIVVEEEQRAHAALELVIMRAALALEGVPKEVRRALEDGTSEYMRPMPGAARMYPETDVPPETITEQMMKALPDVELYEERIARFMKKHELNEEMATQIVKGGMDDTFEELVGGPAKGMGKVTAATLLNTLPELEKENVVFDPVDLPKILGPVIHAHGQGRFSKEGIAKVLRAYKMGAKDIEGAIKMAGLGGGGADKTQVEAAIAKILDGRKQFIKENGMKALKPLMGAVMEELRGKAEGQVINETLKRMLEERVE